jgi:hypothetical protein
MGEIMPVARKVGERLQERDDRWAPPIIGVGERGNTVSGFNPGWAVGLLQTWAGMVPRGHFLFLFYFIFFFSFF